MMKLREEGHGMWGKGNGERNFGELRGIKESATKKAVMLNLFQHLHQEFFADSESSSE